MTLDDLIATKPVAEFEVSVSESAISEYRERGFTSIPRITTEEEVEWFRAVHDALFAEGQHMRAGFISDVINPIDRPRAAAQSQFIMPEARFGVLRHTAFWRNGRALAAQLLGVAPEHLEGWGHMIRKPPHGSDHVHWHQDEGYWDTAFDYTAVACWMPLDAATAESGCMRFVPGSHLGDVRRHHFLNEDPTGTSLVVDDVEEKRAVLAPIPVGGASFHHCRTLHASGPNMTDHVRRAHICEWQLPPVRRARPADRPWVAQGRRAKSLLLPTSR
jgi:hypothetical protein